MMLLELADIMFFVKQLKNPVKITDRLYFFVANTRSGSHGKLVQSRCKNSGVALIDFGVVELFANYRP